MEKSPRNKITKTSIISFSEIDFPLSLVGIIAPLGNVDFLIVHKIDLIVNIIRIVFSPPAVENDMPPKNINTNKRNIIECGQFIIS